MSSENDLEALLQEADDIDDPLEAQQETHLQVMTPEEEYAVELEKIENKIVELYVAGASVRQLCNRFPKYDERSIGELLTTKLSVRHMNPDHLVGAGVFGYDEDLKALTDFIEEAGKGSAVKLSAIKGRAEIREKKLKHMQSVGILPDKTNPFEAIRPGEANLESITASQQQVTAKFHQANNPEDRLAQIEALEGEFNVQD